MKPLIHLQERAYCRSVLAILSIAVALVMFTEAMLTPALPLIQVEFATPAVWNAWILAMVLLVGAIITPIIGTCGDIYGKKRVLTVCMIIYILGIVGGGWAPSLPALLLFRAMQGFGMGIFPLGYALIREQFPEDRVAVSIGTIAAMFGAGTLLGIFAGSWIVEHWGWRMTFQSVMPAVIVLILLIALVVVPSPRRAASLDLPGMAAFTATLLALVLMLTLGGQMGWTDPIVILLALMVPVCALVLREVERRAAQPMLNLSMVRRRSVFIALALGIIIVMATFMVIQTMPFLIESPTGLGLSSVAVGLILIPGSFADMIAGPLAGILAARKGIRITMIIGSAVLLAGAVGYVLAGRSVPGLILAGILFNAGMSATLTGNTIIIVREAVAAETATWTAVYHTAQNMGGMSGPVIAGAILGMHSVEVPGWDVPLPAAEGFLQIFQAVLLLSLLSLLIALCLRSDRGAPT
ncbi:MFS transporter [Methanofollis fontis]|uniref:MFS transporter n=1 Tax=Methanofollis fontis TaxID=2052832 RepID=UPI0013EE6A66|nr:MFS transporter [Methanofollis fontis]